MPGLMERLRHALGLDSVEHHPTDEQTAMAQRQKRIAQRQKAIDIQVSVLAADRRDERHRR